MGDYRLRHEADELGGREARIRTHRSTYSLAQDGEPSVVRQSRELSITRAERDQLPPLKAPIPSSTALPAAKAIPQHLQERYLTASPIGINRQSTPAPGSAEHSRLMVESMALFESTVAKLPSGVTGVSSLGSIPSGSTLVRNAQVLVGAAERVNELMRAGTTRALEEQINAEVEGTDSASGQEMLEVWRQVGGEYREGLRASDELVRALTSFLMDTGSILRKLASAPAISEIGSPAVHARSISLDEEAHRSQPRLGDGSDGGSGRESRSGWETSVREREREETLRKLAGVSSGRESSLSLARAPPTLAALRDRERLGYETPSPASSSRPLPSIGSGNPVRRLFTPREPLRPLDAEDQRLNDTQPSTLQPSDSQRTLQAEPVEPSPTHYSRTISRDRSRTLPPIPQPPSEPARRTPVNTRSPATRVDSRPDSVRDRTHERRKPSVASVATVRGSGPTFTSLTTPSSATAVITHHTVSSSPEVARSNSDRSVRSTVTFSQPSSASSAALSDIHQQAIDDERRRGGDQQQQEMPASSSSAFKTPARPTASSLARAKSVSEGAQRRTIGARTPRASLDGEASGAVDSPSVTKISTAHAADRSAVLTALPGVRREKRRTVTDIFPQQ
ncbi:hypothetical protein EST38_g1783 [Candolleomyces aberdarensis]|uniref:Uncharacterized protein n=1 Tax=Candolleomyces aberdarensis TaxID=2316362 RepID=A0A4Q2DWQ1_9AGAR|nr:hypothetical protein EST38_g1783 [Candolleomyces aberdarensis]